MVHGWFWGYRLTIPRVRHSQGEGDGDATGEVHHTAFTQRLVDRLGSGTCHVGRIGLGVRVSASFHIFALRIWWTVGMADLNRFGHHCVPSFLIPLRC